jgi:hypothetical protein
MNASQVSSNKTDLNSARCPRFDYLILMMEQRKVLVGIIDGRARSRTDQKGPRCDKFVVTNCIEDATSTSTVGKSS